MPRGPPHGRSSLSGRSELPWRFRRPPSSTSLPSPRISSTTFLVLPIILSLGFDNRFPSVLSETDRTTGLMTRRSSRMVKGCYGWPIGRGTFAPASATTRSVVTPESALESFPPASDSRSRTRPAAPGHSRLAAPHVLFGSSHRASSGFHWGVIDWFHDGTMNLEPAPELMVAKPFERSAAAYPRRRPGRSDGSSQGQTYKARRADRADSGTQHQPQRRGGLAGG
jgi:hypothetical protein